MSDIMLNITMPVFNRYELTQRSLLALRKCARGIPFSVTVVDNGSDMKLVEKLLEFKSLGIIDKLFLLEQNFGIATAANIGWEMTDAPFYMKLDNDIVINDKDFFGKVFSLWSHGEALSTLGGAPQDLMLRHPGAIRTKDGILGICGSTLSGQAMFIPKQVSDILGFWSEDYGRFNVDGDYGLRVHCMGFPQYYYQYDNFWTDYGTDLQETYLSRNLDKEKEKQRGLVDDHGGFGLFLINQSLYNLCIRTWRPVRKYLIADISADCKVRLEENEEFKEYKRLLEVCASTINKRVKTTQAPNPDSIFTPDFVQELKDIMKSGGYDCDTFTHSIRGAAPPKKG